MALDTARAVATLRSLTVAFDNAVDAAMPFYPEVCTIVPSDGADEEYGILGNMPGVKEWLGDRQFQTLRGAKFTIANRKWENSVGIEKDDIDDSRLGLYGPVLAELGSEAAHHPDELLFEVLVNGESQACLDGQFFFDLDHKWGDSGTQSNDLTSTAAVPSKPTATEFRTAFHAAREAMLNFKRDNGKFYVRPAVRPLTQLMCVVPTEHELPAHQAFDSQLLGGGDSNIVLDKPVIVTSPHLTNNDRFYLFNRGTMLKPFVFQARKPLARQMKGLDDAEFKDVKFMADARYNVGYLAWWNAVVTTLTV